EGTFEAAVEVLTKVRGAKTLAQKSLRWPVARLAITGPEASRAALQPVLDDILRAGNVAEGGLELADGVAPENERFAITVTLGENGA
nr:valine--tRNA ligase [Thermoanaerobaculales bacterium]